MNGRSIITGNGHFLCHQYSVTLVDTIKAITDDAVTA